MSYTCNMLHLHSYWPYSHKFYWKVLSVRYNWLWDFWSPANFCIRKVKRVQFHKQNNALLRSLKYYTVNLFVEGLRKVHFLNYESFSNTDAAYTDFLNKLMKVINEIALSKEIRNKSNNKDWYDREFADLIHARGKLFLKCENSKLHIDG